jgi:hypothetical protein
MNHLSTNFGRFEHLGDIIGLLAEFTHWRWRAQLLVFAFLAFPCNLFDGRLLLIDLGEIEFVAVALGMHLNRAFGAFVEKQPHLIGVV